MYVHPCSAGLQSHLVIVDLQVHIEGLNSVAQGVRCVWSILDTVVMGSCLFDDCIYVTSPTNCTRWWVVTYSLECTKMVHSQLILVQMILGLAYCIALEFDISIGYILHPRWRSLRLEVVEIRLNSRENSAHHGSKWFLVPPPIYSRIISHIMVSATPISFSLLFSLIRRRHESSTLYPQGEISRLYDIEGYFLPL